VAAKRREEGGLREGEKWRKRREREDSPMFTSPPPLLDPTFSRHGDRHGRDGRERGRIEFNDIQ